MTQWMMLLMATEDTVLRLIAKVHVDTDTRFVLLFTGHFCAVLQHVRRETMVGVGPGKRQGVCVHVML